MDCFLVTVDFKRLTMLKKLRLQVWSNVYRIRLSADNAGLSVLMAVLLNVTPYRGSIRPRCSTGLQCNRNVQNYSHHNTASHPRRLESFNFWSVCKRLYKTSETSRLLTSSCPSVPLSAWISAAPLLHGFPWNLMLWSFMNICWEIPN